MRPTAYQNMIQKPKPLIGVQQDFIRCLVHTEQDTAAEHAWPAEQVTADNEMVHYTTGTRFKKH